MQDLPRGIRKVVSNIGTVRYRAQYTKDKKTHSKIFKTLDEAVEQRKAWVEQYGETKWGSVSDNRHIGAKFGRLTVINHGGTIDDKPYLNCICECGNEVKVRSDALVDGKVKSCGCLFKETISDTARKGRESMANNAVDGVELVRFTDKPFKHNTSGYRGVQEYRPGKFRARIVVKGKEYAMYGFKTAKDAYYNGRLELEDRHLPKRRDEDEL